MNITHQIPAYVYVQYDDDANVSAFFYSYNALSQANLDQVNNYQLPVYLNQTGNLLSWAASSIYGVFRPSLSSGGPRAVGPINTFEFNANEFNESKFVNSSTNYIADDLTYQRIIQWNTFKGDGYQFSIRWLKRRVERFLRGAIFPDQTYEVSVRFTSPYDVLITVSNSNVRIVGGAFYGGRSGFGGLNMAFNQASVVASTHAPTALASALKAAVNSGILRLPFQYTFTVQI